MSNAMIDRALIIRQPWIDLILSGQKPWEMRSRPTKIRGKIGLIEQGTGLIVGECDAVDSLPPQKIGVLIRDHYLKHRIDYMIRDKKGSLLYRKWNCPWVLENIKRYDAPIPYDHPQGAVVWVLLEDYDG